MPDFVSDISSMLSFDPALVLFLFFVALGAMVQAITGFAMALIIMGAVTVLGLAEIAFSAAVVSLIAMVNTGVALRRSHRFVDRQIFLGLIIGLLPFTALGVVLVGTVSATFYDLLRLLLGVVIIGAGSILMVQPAPFETPSSRRLIVAIGAAGGVSGGLYGAAGAPLAWLMYRQPIAFQTIRATLLATFFASTFGRTTVVIVTGQMTAEILLTAAISVPLVIAATIAGGRIAPFVPELLLRRAVFGLLVLIGGLLIFQSLSLR